MAGSEDLHLLPGITSEVDWRTAVGNIYQAAQLNRNGYEVMEMVRIVRNFVISRMRCSEGELEKAFDTAVVILKNSWPLALSTRVGKGLELKDGRAACSSFRTIATFWTFFKVTRIFF